MVDRVSSTQNSNGSKKQTYYLPSTPEERERLEIQHRMMLQILDHKYIKVPVDITTGTAILESGTGTGIWLMELSKTVTDGAELIGIDIVSKLFPARETLPPNVTFQTMSILDLPTEWTNRFTLVNQRFLIAGLRYSEWVTAINNMCRVLKPGGWLQLLEPTGLMDAGPTGNIFHLLLERIRQLQGINGVFPNCGDVLKRLAEEAGFEEVTVTYYEAPVGKWGGDVGIQQRDILVQVLTAMKGVVLKNNGFGVVSGQEEGYEQFIYDWVKEVDEERKPMQPYAMICARKPIEGA
ncbi:Demethylmenaquinone methyltransferase [Leucoagaricus sp. SymC.cos]|nr:Demethylmenaquinone methyltransferase [Leucoagaricus sp. SymC.cos]